ncbi:MAG: DNA polymerase IV [Gemmatimonadota bacterium]|nr:DNA polymerase IV [Gemmatimonadota bacterium]
MAVPALPRRILLVDADAFYVAVARMIDPEGAGKEPLLIVGGSRESRGVVCSASYETRKFGVRSAMPISRALKLCPQAVCVPIPRKTCSIKSGEIRDVLGRWAPVVEGASIDEWYCDLSGTESLYKNEPLDTTAHRIRDDVLASTGLSVSIGGGAAKLVAKLAVERAKPKTGATGVHIVAPDEEAAFLRSFSLAEIPLIGPKFQQRLANRGLRTVADVLAHDETTLERWFGEREAQWLHDRVRGIDDSDVAPREIAKSISRDETFAEDIGDDGELERELLRLVTRAASDLRGDELEARTITVRIRDFDFRTRQASRALPESVIADRVIYQTARELFTKLRRARKVPARLLGVALSTLVDEHALKGPAQLALFAITNKESSSGETERDRVVARTVDTVREKFGSGAIVPGRLK